MQTYQATEDTTIEIGESGNHVRYPNYSRIATDIETALIVEVDNMRRLLGDDFEVMTGEVEGFAIDQTRININCATAAVLELLPSIGAKAATFIVENRPFIDLGDMVAKMQETTLKPSVKEMEGLVSF
jgi:radical SAM superfamily enzyme with C-terminal helix-hairpin-helix motif